jgi:peptide/nickel transport system permease protein
MTGLLERLPRTFLLGVLTVAVIIIIGVPMGISAAIHRGGWRDRVLTVTSMFFISVPEFWLGLMLIIVFSMKLGWLPSFGIATWTCYILPVVSGAVAGIAQIARQTRSSMLEVIRADYVTTARSKGMRERLVTYKHMFPNALIPIITITGSLFSRCVGGTVVIENIFSFPGVGLYLTGGINMRDYPVIRGCVVVLAAFTAILMLVVDLAYGFASPQIKAQYAEFGKKRGRLANPEKDEHHHERGRLSEGGRGEEHNRNSLPEDVEDDAWESLVSTPAKILESPQASKAAAKPRRAPDRPAAKAIVASPLGDGNESMWKQTFRRLGKDKMAMVGLFGILAMAIISIFAPLFTKYAPNAMDLINVNAGPSAEHIFGTDNFGRDYFSRMLYGGRSSLLLGISSSFCAVFLGIVLGAIAGYFGKWADNIIMRLCDIIQAIPGVMISIVISLALGKGFGVTIVALAIGGCSHGIRMTRAQFLSVRKSEYLSAATTINCSSPRIIFKHILPNVISPMLLDFTMRIASMIQFSAGLSVIGLGIQPPAAEWGAMLSAGRGVILHYPHLVMFPGLFIFLVSFFINILGDGMRDALDPKLKK